MQAAQVAQERCQAVHVQVFSDRDIPTQRAKIEAALAEADVFFGSLLFDFDQVRMRGCRHVTRTSFKAAGEVAIEGLLHVVG